MEGESSSGRTDPPTRDNSWTIISMGMVSMFGLMREDMKVSGKQTKCTALVCLPGQMAGSMTEITGMIRNKGEECSHGQTVGGTMVNGTMASNMAKAYIIHQRERLGGGSGRRGRESLGITTNRTQRKAKSDHILTLLLSICFLFIGSTDHNIFYFTTYSLPLSKR